MYKIFYDNSQFVILVDGTQNTSGMIELDAERNYILTLLPIYDKTLFLPISSTAKIVGGKLICKQRKICAVDCKIVTQILTLFK